jgi:hypothetical protein
LRYFLRSEEPGSFSQLFFVAYVGQQVVESCRQFDVLQMAQVAMFVRRCRIFP